MLDFRNNWKRTALFCWNYFRSFRSGPINYVKTDRWSIWNRDLDHKRWSFMGSKTGIFIQRKIQKTCNATLKILQITQNSRHLNVRPIFARTSKSLILWMRGNYQHYTKFSTSIEYLFLAWKFKSITNWHKHCCSTKMLHRLCFYLYWPFSWPFSI